MKKYSTIYYLLFVVVVMGAFASMAQNSYGLKLIGIACFGFFLTFLHEIFFSQLNSANERVPSWISYTELVVVSVTALIFLARNLSIDIAFINSLWIGSLILLMVVFSFHGVNHFREARAINEGWGIVSVFYYSAVILFVMAWMSDALGFLNSLLFVIGSVTALLGFLVSARLMLSNKNDGENLSIWEYFGDFKNKSAILLITCLLVYGYNVLYSADVLPSLYHGNLPPGYHELVEDGEQSDDPAIREKSREFKAAYDKFVSKYAAKE
jgi:hypothetical protein